MQPGLASQTVETDVVIVGGGVAGLWLLNRLRQQKLSVILLESAALGGGQTYLSQGIIHSGMKYAVTGFNQAASAIAEMPTIWRNCLQGTGEIDLRSVPLLSPAQYLWSPKSVAGKVAGFLASFTLRSTVTALAPEQFPAVFQNPQFEGDVYLVPEMVIDVQALMYALANPHQQCIFKVKPISEHDLQIDAEGKITHIDIYQNDKVARVKAQHYIFTAGSGNEIIFNKFKLSTLATQRRPLHMVYVKLANAHPLFAHCLSMSTTPRLTITTHTHQDGTPVWYIGGHLAETGVNRSETEQINFAKKELMTLLPWLDFEAAQWGTCRVDRAEPLQPHGKRPDSACLKALANFIVAWPTKLALAPQLTQEIINLLKNKQLQPQFNNTKALQSWPTPPVAHPPWYSLG